MAMPQSEVSFVGINYDVCVRECCMVTMHVWIVHVGIA
jgi:hypothetical protein